MSFPAGQSGKIANTLAELLSGILGFRSSLKIAEKFLRKSLY
jgi:hypothetical protein